MARLQSQRTIAVSSPLGDDVLLLRSMSGTERLGGLFEYDLDLVSEDLAVKHEDLLGQALTVRLLLPDHQHRYFNGHVSRFAQVGHDGALGYYQATMVPWLWFLSRTADCRIFQEKTVPDIVKALFREHGYTDFDEALTGSYRTWGYCVQYRETDFNFVSRLMEQEGIYYYFRHEENKHVLVLSDSYSSHEQISGYEEVPYYPPDEAAVREREHVTDWTITKEVQPGGYVHTDFDFKLPRKDLLAKRSNPQAHALAEYEIYDYPGEYFESADGENYARVRIEELQADYELAQGEGNARGFTVGGLFKLVNYPREDQNREYLIVSANHQLQSDVFGSSGEGAAGPVYACGFTALDAQIPYRPPRTTPKPVVQGPQTATVVGKAGEEIWTDEHGRVKLQFHWDRYGKSDENSSCWIRVSQVHAGKGFGGIDIPRVGEEVVVECLEGDPDRPIVTGRVYNGDNRPPTDLPKAGMVSGLKSNSTPGGGGFNQMLMDDTQGKEKLTVHAQYDMDTTVENDQTLTVHNNHTSTIDANETGHVKGNRSITVDGNQETAVQGTRTEHVTGSEEVTIDAATKHAINANFTRNVTGDYVLSADGNVKDDAGANWESTAGTKALLKAPAITIEGDSKIEIVCGGSSIKLEPAQITISSGSGSVMVYGPGVDVKGGKIQLN